MIPMIKDFEIDPTLARILDDAHGSSPKLFVVK